MINLHRAAGAFAVLALSAAVPANAQQPDATTAQPAPATAEGTLTSILKADPELSTFEKLAEASGFDTTFNSAGPLTVLAPSNAAFEKLPPEELEALEKPENAARLQQILLYHIIPAAAPSSALKGTAGNVPTAKADAQLRVDGTGDVLLINGAQVTRADVAASNGTVHVIDTVLTPPI